MSSVATSLSNVIWCCSSTWLILLTLTSALSYFAFISASLLELFLKRPKSPFFSSSLNERSSATTPVSISPTSPRSFVRTFSIAASEKSAIFFWQPAPYCNTSWVLVRSICAAKSSTCFCSSGVRCTSATSGFFSSATTSGTLFSSSGVTSKVSVGASFNNSSKFWLISFPFTFTISVFCQMRGHPTDHPWQAWSAKPSHPLSHRVPIPDTSGLEAAQKIR